jgi:hypothetical protein
MPARTSVAKEKMRRELRAIVRKNRIAFEGDYADEIDELLGLSREEINAITPDGTDLATYDQLIEVVKDASRKNLSQAQLKARVKELGEVAVAIARKVGTLAALLA